MKNILPEQGKINQELKVKVLEDQLKNENLTKKERSEIKLKLFFERLKLTTVIRH